MPEPKIVEVDEAELLSLRRVQKTVGSMLNSPSAKKKLASALKEIAPDDPLSKEADKVDPTEQRFAELEKRNQDLEQKLKDDTDKRERDIKLDGIRREQEAGFDRLRQAKWTQDGIDKVKKLMEEKGILDVEIAAQYIESKMPPQNPITPHGTGGWNFLEQPKDTDADLKSLIESKGENTSLLMKMAGDAINEVRGTSRR